MCRLRLGIGTGVPTEKKRVAGRRGSSRDETTTVPLGVSRPAKFAWRKKGADSQKLTIGPSRYQVVIRLVADPGPLPA